MRSIHSFLTIRTIIEKKLKCEENWYNKNENVKISTTQYTWQLKNSLTIQDLNLGPHVYKIHALPPEIMGQMGGGPSMGTLNSPSSRIVKNLKHKWFNPSFVHGSLGLEFGSIYIHFNIS